MFQKWDKLFGLKNKNIDSGAHRQNILYITRCVTNMQTKDMTFYWRFRELGALYTGFAVFVDIMRRELSLKDKTNYNINRYSRVKRVNPLIRLRIGDKQQKDYSILLWINEIDWIRIYLLWESVRHLQRYWIRVGVNASLTEDLILC